MSVTLPTFSIVNDIIPVADDLFSWGSPLILLTLGIAVGSRYGARVISGLRSILRAIGIRL